MRALIGLWKKTTVAVSTTFRDLRLAACLQFCPRWFFCLLVFDVPTGIGSASNDIPSIFLSAGI